MQPLSSGDKQPPLLVTKQDPQLCESCQACVPSTWQPVSQPEGISIRPERLVITTMERLHLRLHVVALQLPSLCEMRWPDFFRDRTRIS